MPEISLDLEAPQFSQSELCEAAEITDMTANNWVQSGALRPADVGGRGARRPRLFSVVTVYQAKVTSDLAKWLKTPPTTSAEIARLTTAGHTWPWSATRDLASNNPRNFYAIVFWSDQCGEWDAWVDIASGELLQIQMKTIAEARGERRLGERPIVVLPVSKYFTSVLKSCQAMLDASWKIGNA